MLDQQDRDWIDQNTAAQFRRLDGELTEKITELRQEVQQGFTDLRQDLGELRQDLGQLTKVVRDLAEVTRQNGEDIGKLTGAIEAHNQSIDILIQQGRSIPS